MPRQVHAAGRRLRESRALILCAELLKRGARSRTVENLTGLKRIAIRDVYRELFGTSPPKGPGNYRADRFTNDHVQQFQSSLARVCLAAVNEAHIRDVVSPELGRIYVEAYDMYVAHLETIEHLITPLCFDKFTQLARILRSKEALAIRKCVRCSTEFVAPAQPGAGNQRHCGFCRIATSRGCARCESYVPLDYGFCKPRRRPMCPEHEAIHRPTEAAKHAGLFTGPLKRAAAKDAAEPAEVKVKRRSSPRAVPA